MYNYVMLIDTIYFVSVLKAYVTDFYFKKKQ